MNQTIVKAAFVTPDGKIFGTKQEAQDYLRKPQIENALGKIKGANKDVVGFLIEKQDEIEAAFECGSIARVTKSERKQLEKAVNYVVETLKDDPKAKFVVANAGAIIDSFRWPAVKRMTDEEKATATTNSLNLLTENNADLTAWIITNKDGILEGYKAGIEKREVSQKTLDALAAARQKRDQASAAKKAAEAAAAPADGGQAAPAATA